MSNIQPQDIEAEKALIAELLNYPKKQYELPVRITSEMFFNEEYGHIFQAITELETKADAITVSANLKNKGTLDLCGGHFAIMEIMTNTSQRGRIDQYAVIILEKFIQRKMITASTEIIQSVEDLSVFDLIDSASQKIYDISQHVQGNKQKSFVEIVDQAAQEAIDLGMGKRKAGIDTPLKGLTESLGGWQNGKVYILAGRPGMGKTSFALNCVQEAAKNGHPSMLVSLEMTEVEIAKRLFSLISDGVTGSMMFSRGPQSESEYESINMAKEKLQKLNMFLSSEFTGMSSLKSKIKMHVAAKGVKFVCIDYLQLIQPISKKGTKEQEVSELSREVKKLALELNIPILLLSQLSRACESRNNKRPMLSDLRDSGAIEQDADAVLFLYRDSVYTGVEDDESAEVILAKNRNGKLGMIECTFISNRMLYIDQPTQMIGKDMRLPDQSSDNVF